MARPHFPGALALTEKEKGLPLLPSLTLHNSPVRLLQPGQYVLPFEGNAQLISEARPLGTWCGCDPRSTWLFHRPSPWRTEGL